MTRERRRNALIFGLIVQNHADMLLQERYVNFPLRMAVSISGYILRPVILVLFCHVLTPAAGSGRPGRWRRSTGPSA